MRKSSSGTTLHTLEARRLLAIAPDPTPEPGAEVEVLNPSATTVSVVGTDGDDVIGVHQEHGQYVIIVNSRENTAKIPLSGLSGVRYYLHGGDDCLVIQKEVSVPVTVFAGDGDDRVFTSAGADRIEGGAGRDSLYGNAGDDRLYGGGGADRLVGGSGRDFLYGGTGRDRSDRDTRDRRHESIESFL